MAQPHYFSPDPGASQQERTFEAALQGRAYSVTTTGSVFSAQRLDPGTAVLLREVPAPPQDGVVVDVGCGWGPVTLALAAAAPGAEVLAVDVSERARALTRRNVESAGFTNVTVTDPEGAAQFLAGREVSAIWSNPPVRVGKAALHDLLREWVPRLAPGAEGFFVVSKNLGADSLQRWMVDQGWPTRRLSSTKGFRILVATST